MNNTLVNKDACCCAVGNLVASNCGYEIQRHPLFSQMFLSWFNPSTNKYLNPSWPLVFFTSRDTAIQKMKLERYTDEAKIQIDSTGYSVSDLAQIEHAFEMGCKENKFNDEILSGLMAVVDVLDTIHENTDETIIEKITTNFKNKKEIILC